MAATPAFAVAAIGVDHPHIFEMTREMLRAGTTIRAFLSPPGGRRHATCIERFWTVCRP